MTTFYACFQAHRKSKKIGEEGQCFWCIHEGFHDGVYFKGSFELCNLVDTYLDLSNFKKGVIWVNGYNLGRY